MVRRLAREKIAPRVHSLEREAQFPWEEIELLAKQDLLGMGIPEEYGGAEADSLSVILSLEELARVSSSISVLLEVHHCLVSESILFWGDEYQKEKYLPSLCQGHLLGAFALTEPLAGSDASSITTRANRENNTYTINGTKSFITGAGEADLYLVLASTHPRKGKKGITAFLIRKDNPGLSSGLPEEKMGLMACHTGELSFTNCQVDEEDRLGEEGEGLKIALSALDRGRLGIAAQAIGLTQAAFDASLSYAREREQFGKSISSFQAIQWMFSDMATDLRAARLLTYSAAMKKERGERITMEASMAKVFASEMAMRHTTKAVQIHGGYGYMIEYGVERLMREAKATEIYEGTSEIQRLIIARELLKNHQREDFSS